MAGRRPKMRGMEESRNIPPPGSIGEFLKLLQIEVDQWQVALAEILADKIMSKNFPAFKDADRPRTNQELREYMSKFVTELLNRTELKITMSNPEAKGMEETT